MTDAVNPQDVSRAVSEAYSEGLQQGEDYEPSSRRVSEGIQKHLHENFENLAEQAESHNAATGTTDTFDKSNFDKAQAFRTIARLTDGKIQGASEEAGTLNRDELVALYEAAEDGEQFIEMMLATDSFAGLSGMNLGMTGTGRNLKRNENVESPLFKATEKYFENNKYDNRGARGGGQFHDHHFRKGEVGIEVDTQGKDKHELFQEFLEIVDPGATTGELFQVGNVQGADVQGTIGNDAVAMGGAVVESHVDTGLGDDLVVAEEVALVDSQVQTSDGDDRVALQGGAQNAVVDGGDGNDDVRFQGVALDSTFALGGDGDKALLAGQFVNTTIYGDRTFEDSEEGYEAGDGSDEITFAGAARNLQTFAGGGDDQIAIEGHIEDSVFDGGDGDDRMLFRGHYANSRVELGRGNDTALIGDDFTGDLTIHDPKRGRVDWKGKNLKDQDGLLLQGDWTRIDERTFGRLDETGEIVGRVHLDGDVDDLEFIGTDGGEVFQAHQPKQDDPPFLVSALRIAGPVLTVASIAFPAAAPLAIAAKAATAVNAVVSGDRQGRGGREGDAGDGQHRSGDAQGADQERWIVLL
ncbi:MAG: calcium-binding protein, partial [Acidobacteriota bacterium]